MQDFDRLKKSLMRDLQNRCEKVVELEISLDETRDQYAKVLKSNNSKSLQKKMTFLERNLEQLTSVQKQLVDQNAALKKNYDSVEKKIDVRNKRIADLEKLLQELSDKLKKTQEIHEKEIAEMNEKAESLQAKHNALQTSFTFGDGRIAKPLRGGQEHIEEETFK